MPTEFGLGTATFLVLASMVGVGVLTTSGYTVALIGSNHWMLWLWLLGGLVAISGALALAELSAFIPRTGGDYVYLYEAYGPLPAFLSGWVSFLIGFAGPSAAAAFGAAKYFLTPFLGSTAEAAVSQRLLASALIAAFSIIHIMSRSTSARVQGVVTVLKISILALFGLVGLVQGADRFANLLDPTPVSSTTLITMLGSMVYISYAYIGWNAASYLAGEIREPERLLPRAITLGVGSVVLLYLLLNIVYGLALSAADIREIIADPANKQGLDAVAPIAELAARRLFGPSIATPFGVIVGLLLLSTLSAYILVGPRVVYAMAKSGQFPAFAAQLSRRTETPAVATMLQSGVALLLLWTGTFENLVVYASVGLSIFSMLAISSIFVLRVRKPFAHRPFHCPGYPYTPFFFLLATLILTAAAFHERPVVSLISLASILAGVPIYYLGGFNQVRIDPHP